MTQTNVKGETKGLAKQDMEGTLDGGTGRLGHWMEQVVREAEQRGDFDALPGKGKPLSIREYDPFAGPEGEVYGLLKKAGFTPEWVEWRRKITDAVNWIRANPTHPERPSRIVEVNILIDQHNRQIPNPSLALPKVPRDFGR